LHCQNRSANILAAMASTRLDQIIGKIKHLGEAAT
jgi:hypothetical protein